MNPEYNQPLPDLAKETVLFQLKRHPIGIFTVYLTSIVLLIFVAVIAFGIAPKYINDASSGRVYEIAATAYLIFLSMVLGFVYISHIVYWDNSWTLTTESLAQVSRSSLFDKQSSHLSLGNLQDVTASQEGILPHLFNYGSLRVETAGENTKFIFQFCPNPDLYAEHILDAREKFEQGLRIAVNNGLQSPSQTAVYQAAPPLLQPETVAQTYPIPPQPPTDPSVG